MSANGNDTCHVWVMQQATWHDALKIGVIWILADNKADSDDSIWA